MTQQKLILSSTGEPMLSAKNAAKQLSCTPDYISKLCREGKLRGSQIQGAWFVEKSSLKAFEVARTQARFERSEQLARQRREENEMYRKEVQPAAVSFDTLSEKAGAYVRRTAVVALAAVFLFGAIAMAGGAPRLEKNTQLSAALAHVESPFFTSFSKVFSALGLLLTTGGTSPAPVAQTPAPTQSIVNNYTTNNYTTNNTNNNSYHTSNSYSSTVSDAVRQSDFDAKLNGLRQDIFSQINNAQGPYSSGGPTNNIALTQRIDHLDGVTISNATIHSLSGLTDADIPDTITVANYLPLTGGVINGDLTITGTCTGCGGGGGSASDANWSYFNNSGVRLSTTTNQVLIGASATTSNSRLEVAGGATFDQATSSSFFSSVSSSTNSYSTTATIATANIGMASTSQFFGANLAVCESGNVLTWNNGLFGCAVDQTSTGQANPFTWSSNYGVVAAATTSPLSLPNGVFASSTSHFTDADFANATTNSLTIGNLNGILKATNGLVSTATAGVDYATLSQISAAFPFTPSFNFGVGVNSTSTKISFTQGIFASSTSQFAGITASDIFTSQATAANVFPFASTTALTVSGTGYFANASTTNLTLSSVAANNLLKTTTGGAVTAAVAGTDYVTGAGLASAFPFTPGTNFGVGVNSTSTIINFTSGLFASSTSQFTTINSGSLTTNSLTLGTVTGPLQAINGAVSATSTLSVVYGGTGLSQVPTYGQLLVGNANGGYTLTATSSLGITSLSSLSALYPLIYNSSTGLFSLGFGTTTANTWSAQQNFSSFFATNASTTNATTSSLYIGSLTGILKSTNGLVSTATAGTDYLTSANIFAFPFTPGTNFGVGVNSTSTIINFTNGLFASSTSNFAGISTISATTTSLSIGTLNGLLNATNGLVGTIATSTLGIAISDTTGTLSQSRGGTGLTTYNPGDILYADNGGNLVQLPVGSTGQVLKVQAGLPSWGVDQTVGGGGSDGIFATSTGRIYPLDTSNVVIIGSNSTTTANSIFEVSGQAYVSTKLGIATSSPSQALSVGGNGYFSGALGIGLVNTAAGTLQTSGNALIGGNLGVGTSSPSKNLSVHGNSYVSGTSFFGGAITATSTLSVSGLSTLAGFISSASSTVNGSLGVTGTLSIANNITGPLQAVNGVVSATSTLSTSYGGTGISTVPTLGQILVGNSAGTYSLFATSTLGLLSSSSISATAPLSYNQATGAFSITQAGAAQNGYLSSTDWNTFNNKISSTSLSAGAGISYNSSTGIITNTIGYPFIGNATTTTLAFNGGLTTTGATSTGTFAVTSSTTLASLLNVGGALNANNSLTVLGNTSLQGATSTSFAISNISSGSILKTTTGGAIVAAVSGTDYVTGAGLASAFPFTPGTNFGVGVNSTSTTINFTNGLFASSTSNFAGISTISATTTNLLSTGSTTIAGIFNAVSGAQFGTLNASGIITSTATGANVFPYASSTALTVSGTGYFGAASTTNLTVSGIASGSILKTTTGGVVTTAVAGTDYLTSANIFAFPFTPGTNFGVGVNSTSTTINFTNGLFASSTSQFVNAIFTGVTTTNAIITNATSTTLNVTRLTGANLSSCSGTTDKLLWNSSTSLFSCGTDAGSTGATELNWQFFNNSGLRLGTTTNQVLIGASSTSTLSKLEVVGGATFDNATSSNLSVSGIGSFAGSVGIGTTSPQEKFTVAGGTILQTASGNPTLATSTYLGSGAIAYSSFVSGRYAYVAADAAGLKILDISNPASSSVIGTYSGIVDARSVVVAGNYAYVGDATNGLVILDVSRPSSPVLVSSIAAGDPLALGLSGRYVIVPDIDTGAVNIVDVANPASPSIIGSYTAGSAPSSVAVSGKFVYVGDAGTGRVYVTDITNPASPLAITSLAGFTTPSDLYASGRYLYVADAATGLTVLDISNPASPVVAGSFASANGYYSVRVAGDYAYVATNIDNTLQVLDVRTPSAIASIGSLSVGSQARNVFVAGKYAYVSAGGNTLKIININGAKLPSASIGALDTSVLNIADKLTVGSDIYANGGINVGLSGIFSRGGLAVFGSTTLTDLIARTSTTTGNAYFGGNVGVGTSTPSKNLSVQGNSYVSGTSFFGGAITATSTLTVSGLSSLTGFLSSASSSVNANLSVTGTASTTALTISGIATGNILKTTTAGAVTAATAGVDYVTGAGLASAFPFTPGTNFGVGVNSTTTPLWLKGATGGTYSLMASSTSVFDQIIIGSSTNGTLSTSTTFGNFVVSGNASTSNLTVSKTSIFGQGITANSTLNIAGIITSTATGANILPYASSTALTVSGTGYFPSGIWDSSGNVGIGTTTPITNLSVNRSGSFNGVVSSDLVATIVNSSAATSLSALAVVSGSTGTSSLLLGANGASTYNNGRIVYNSTLNALSFWTLDAQQLTIDSSGNVGIATTSPWGQLSVTNTGSNPGLVVANSSNNATQLIVDSSGNVGVGTSTPGKNFAVHGTSYVSGTSFFGGAITATSSLAGLTSASTTALTISGIATGNILKTTTAGAVTAATAGVDYVTGAGLASAFPFTPTTNFGALANSTSTPIWFTNGVQASSTSQFVNANFSGNVGVGTSSPLAKINIFGDAGLQSPIFSTLGITSPSSQTRYGQAIQSVTTSGSTNAIGAQIDTVTASGLNLSAAGLALSNVSSFGTSIGLIVDTVSTGLTMSGGPAVGAYINNVSTNSVGPAYGLRIANVSNASTTNKSNVIAGIQIENSITNTANSNNAFALRSLSTANSYFAGNVGIGTTTPNWNLQVAGTRPSIALTDSVAGTDLKHWLLSSMGGNFYLGTSSDAFATATPAAFSVLNNGNVGVASSTPWGVFTVTNTGLNPSFIVEDKASDTTPFLIDGNGNVGIGTATPTAKVSLFGDLDIGRLGSPTYPNNLQTDAQSLYSYVDDSNAWIFSEQDENAGFTGGFNFVLDNDGTAAPQFSLFNKSATTSVPLLRVMSSGNVGIGTSSPYAKLSVSGQVVGANFTATTSAVNTFPYASTTALTVSDTASTTNLTISSIASGSILKTTTAGAVTAATAGVDYVTGAGLASAFPFTPTTNFGATTNATTSPIWFQGGIQASSTSYVGSATFLSTGNVGVGTTSPWANLSVINSGSTPGFVVSSSSNVPQLIVDASGNIGIGSTSPNRKLVINGGNTFAAAANQGIVEFSQSGSSISLGFGRLQNSFANAASYIESYSNTLNSTQPLVLNPFAGTSNYVAIGTTTAYAALGLRSGGSTSATRALEISNNASTTLFLVDNAGSVGIGTTTPQERLSIAGGSIFQAGGDTVTSYTPKSLGGVDLGLAVGQSGFGGQNISVVGNTAYLVTASTTAGATGCSATDASDCEFRIYDVSNPASPVFQGGADLGNIGNGVTVAGHYAYIVKNSTAGTCSTTVSTGCDFLIYDIANPSAPAFVGGIDLAASGDSVVVSGRYAYLTNSSVTGNDFRIIDISNPANPVVVGGLDLASSGLGIRVQGNYAYIAHGNVASANDVGIVDISNPANPVVVGGVDVASNVRSVYVSGNYMYIGKDNSGITEDFIIYDISNPTSPATTTAIDVGLVQSIAVSGRYAYIGLSSVSGNDLKIYDVSDPYNVVSVGGVDVATNVQGVFISGRRAYLGLASVSGNDFRIYDVSGADVQSLVAGSADFGSAQVRNDLIVNGNGTFNALNIDAGGVFSRGGIFSYVASSTATTPVSAAFIGGNVGVGTTSPWANLAIQSTAGTPQFVIGSSTTQFIVDKSGNVGIATTSPWAQFSVTNTGSNPGLVVANSTNSTTQFIVDSSGNVGVGTSTPSKNLSVQGNSYFASDVGIGTASPNSRLDVTLNDATTNATSDILTITKKTTGTAAAGIGANLLFNVQRADGNISNAASISGLLSGVGAGSGTNGVLTFSTSPNSSGLVERLRITSSGNIGIGTTTPAQTLSVQGNQYTSGTAFFGGAITATSSLAGLTSASTTALTISGIATGNILKTTTAGAVTAATAGVDYVTGAGLASAFPFTPSTFGTSASNATSTLIGFTNGLYTTASSTIGSGAQNGGLTILGGATTTANAYFAANVGIGTTTPQARLGIQGGIGVNATQLYLAANGQVAINTLTPNNRGSLEVRQLSDTSANGIGITNSGVTSEGRLFIDSSGTLNLYSGSAGASTLALNTTGNVGIGTSTPSANLEIGDSSASSVTGVVTNSGSGVAAFSQFVARNDYTGLTGTRIVTTGTGFTNSGIFVQDGGALVADNNLSGGLSVAATAATGAIRFYSGGTTERMRLDTSGNLGIGTTTPQWLLNPTSATASQLSLSAGGGLAQWAFRNAGGNLYLATTTVAGTATTTIPALTIVGATGNIGIGTTSPQEKLSLTGGNFIQAGGDSTQTYTPTTLGGVDLGVAGGLASMGGQALSVVGNTAYVGTQLVAGTGCSVSDQSGCELRIYDVSTSTPRFLGGIDTKNGSNADVAVETLAVAGNYAYVGVGSAAGTCSNTSNANGCDFRIFNLSNPTNPVQVGGLDITTVRDIVVSGRYAYITNSSVTGNDFRIIDVSDPTNPVTVGGVDLGQAGDGLYVQGNYAYVATANASAGFQIIDISNPASPVVVSTMNLGSTVNSVYVSGNYAYVGKINAGITEDFIIYDISNPAAPATTTAFNVGVAVESITVSGRYAYVGVGSVSGNDFRIYDVSDPYNVFTVGGVDVSTSVYNVAVSGHRAFIGKANAGITNDFVVYDISGAEVQSLLAHSFEAGNASIRNNLIVSGNGTFSALNVGQGGFYSNGPLSVFIASTTATTPVSAAFIGGNVGVGTTSPWANLAIQSTAGTPQFVIGSSTTQFIVDKSGNVGIATTSPWAQFSVTNTGSNPGLVVANSTNSTTQFIVDSSGNVGVGTTSPASFFGSQANLAIHSTALGNSTLTLDGYGTGGASLILNRNSVASWSSLIDFGTAGTLDWQLGTNNDSTRNFHIMDGSSNDRLTILNSNGNVGVGTTSPAQMLAVHGNSYVSGTSFFGGAITATSTLNITGAITSAATSANTFPYASTTALTVSGAANFTNLTASRLVATDASKNLTSTLTLANLVSSLSDVSGSTGTTNLVLSASPTLTGTILFGGAAAGNTAGLRFVPDSSGISYIQAGTSTTDIGAELRFTRYSTTGSNIANFKVFADSSYFSGSLGIGTVSPKQNLQVVGNALIGTLSTYDAPVTSNPYLHIGDFVAGSSANANGELLLGHVSSSVTGDILGQLSFYSSDDSSTATGRQAAIKAITQESAGRSAALAFFTGTGTDDSSLERMRIDASGNIGIGTSTPGKNFAVHGTSYVSGTSFFGGAITATSSLAGLTSASTTALTISGIATGNILKTTTAGAVTAATAGVDYVTGAGLAAAFDFTPTNNFGANTNATSTTLSLFGGLYASSTVRFGNAGVSPFFYDGSVGSVGIGTTSPSSLLTVGAGTATTEITVDGGSNGFANAAVVLKAQNGTNNRGTGTYYYDNGSGTEWFAGRPYFGTIGSSDNFVINRQSGLSGHNQNTASVAVATNLFTITSGGNVGIATTSPWGQLSVTNTGSNPGLVVANSSNNATQLIVDSSGNVGVGTSTPGKNFAVHGTSYVSGTSFFGGAITATSTLNIAGIITSTATGANVFPYASTTALTSSGSAYFATSGGNVGIGNTSPYGQLDIASTTAGQLTDALILRNSSITTGTEVGLFFSPTNAANNIRGARISGVQENGSNAIGLKFYTGAGATISEQVRITSLGRVGIGTSSPQEKFTVAGGNIFQAGGDNTNTYTFTTLGGVDLGIAAGLAGAGGQAISVVGNNAYIGIQAIAGTGCTVNDPSGCELRIYDVSTSTPRFLSGIDTKDGSAGDVAIEGVTTVGNYAYAGTASASGTCSNASNSNGCDFRIYDISNPIAPRQVGGLDIGTTVFSVAVVGRYAYITNNSIAGNDFRIIDISDPTNPVTVGGLDLSNSGFGVTIQGNYAYLASQNTGAGVRIIDISNPSSPVSVSTINLAVGATAVAVQGNYLYVGKFNSGITEDLIIYDVSNPASPATTTAVDLGVRPETITVAGRYMYVGTDSAAGNDVKVYDISDPYNIFTIGGVDVSTNVFSIVVRGKQLFVGKANAGITNDFVVYDISGTETQSLYAHSAQNDTLTVNNSLTVTGSGNLFGLNVGQNGIYSNGALSVFTASTTATSPVSASFMGGSVGIGTTSPAALLAVHGNQYTSGTAYFGGAITATSTLSVSGLSSLTGFLSSASSTVNANLYVVGTASTTALTISGIATGNILKTTTAGAITAATAGVDYVTGAGLASAFPFTPTTNFGANTNATSTTLSLLNGLNASSTVRFGNAGVSGFTFIGTTGFTGIGSTTPWGLFSVNPTNTIGTGPAFVVGSSTATKFIVDNVGNVGVATTSPSLNYALSVGGSLIVGNGSASVLTLNVGQVNRIAATTTIPNQPNGYSIATSTATGNGPVFSISGNSATSTISFFGATSTLLAGGVGVAANSDNRNTLIIGNGKTIANVAVVNGNICVDNDGWCTAATTTNGFGRITARQLGTGGSDLAEQYTNIDGTAHVGDIIAANGGVDVTKATTTSNILGIVSTFPGLTLGLGPDDVMQNAVPVALSGRVPTKVSLQNGPIAVGDRITLSSIPGVGMKANPLDVAVAIALESYDEHSTSTSILAFISLNKGVDATTLAQILASSTATTSAPALLAGPFASASQAVKNALTAAVAALGSVAQEGIHQLGTAVHASLAVFDTIVSQTITASVLNVDQVNAKTLCLDDLCITKTQLQNILNGQGSGSGSGNSGGGTGGGTGSSTPDTEAPVITLNGNNPATVSIGSTYTDLGAVVTDNVDTNLGFTVSLDGGATTTLDQLNVDTATSTTHTIIFSATDQAGNTGTATRTVVVE